MNLSVQDRIILLGTLPKEGDITTLRIVRQLRTELGFNELELVTTGLISDDANGRMSWKQNVDKEITIGPKANSIIVATLEDLNRQKKLTEMHIDLYERFVEDKCTEQPKSPPEPV